MATESATDDVRGVSLADADAPPSVFEFELPPEEALGLTFAPPRDGVIRHGLSIRHVANARFQPTVELGDLVVTINGEPLDGLGYAAAVERIRALPRPLAICIEVHEPRRACARAEEQRVDHDWASTLTTYAVAFEESPMGINLEDATRYGIVGAAVRAIKGVARNTQQIAIGDILAQVNDTTVLWMPYKEVMVVTHSAPSPRTLRFVPKDMHADVLKLSDRVPSNGAMESAAEKAKREREWDEANAADNLEALRAIRRCLPVNVKTTSERDLQELKTPNGKRISHEMVRKFKRTNVLELLRVNPSEIIAAHPSMLDNLRMEGLTVTERRALYHHLRDVGKAWEAGQHDELTKRKWEWFQRMKGTCRRVVNAYQQHVIQYGPAGNHPYATSEHPGLGCPLEGKQCPIKANSAPAYDDDLGFPDGDVFMEPSPSNNSTCDREDARLHTLKQHYNRNVRRVAEANGACEVMERMLNTIQHQQLSLFQTRLEHQQNHAETASEIRHERQLWIELAHQICMAMKTCADRAGLDWKDTQGNPPPESLDTRSSIECKLAILLSDAAVDCVAGIDDRLTETGVAAECVIRAIAQVRALGEQLKERSLATLNGMKDKGPILQLQSKTRAELLGEASANLRAAAQSRGIGDGSVPDGDARGGNDDPQRDSNSATLLGLRAAAVAEPKQTMATSSGATSTGKAGATPTAPALGALALRTCDVSFAIERSAVLPGSTLLNSKLLENDDRVYWRGRHWIWRRLVRFLQRLWRKATRRLQ